MRKGFVSISAIFMAVSFLAVTSVIFATSASHAQTKSVGAGLNIQFELSKDVTESQAKAKADGRTYPDFTFDAENCSMQLKWKNLSGGVRSYVGNVKTAALDSSGNLLSGTEHKFSSSLVKAGEKVSREFSFHQLCEYAASKKISGLKIFVNLPQFVESDSATESASFTQVPAPAKATAFKKTRRPEVDRDATGATGVSSSPRAATGR